MKCICRYQWVAVVLAGLALCCAPASPGKEQTKAVTTQASPPTQPTPEQFAEVDRAIQRVRTSINRSLPLLVQMEERSIYAEKVVKELSYSFTDSFTAVLRSPRKYQEPEDELGMDAILIQAVGYLVKNGQRDRLVELLSVRVPWQMGSYEIEAYLVEFWPGPDPILIYRDAYLRSVDPENKAGIAAGFRAAFGANGIADENDDKLVQKCVDWYNRHRGALDIVHEFGRGRDCEVVPLFLPAGTKVDPRAGWGYPLNPPHEAPSTRRASSQPRSSPSTRPATPASNPAGTK